MGGVAAHPRGDTRACWLRNHYRPGRSPCIFGVGRGIMQSYVSSKEEGAESPQEGPCLSTLRLLHGEAWAGLVSLSFLWYPVPNRTNLLELEVQTK